MLRRISMVILGAAVLTSMVVGSVGAEPTGREFGQHIACVAQNGDNMGGLSGQRNPGRHQGYSNVADSFISCQANEGPAATHGGR